MKNLIISLFACGCFSLAQAQIHPQPDSSRTMHSHNDHGTDSVKRGNQIFQGGKGGKNSSQGDTLRHKDNKTGMRQEHGTPRSSSTATMGSTPKPQNNSSDK